MSTRKTKPRGFLRFKEQASRTSLTIVLAVFVFVILMAAIGLAAVAIYVLTTTGVLSDLEHDLQLGMIILLMTVISLVIGGVIAFFSSRIPLKPINNLINKMNRLASGDFKARLKFGTVLSSHPAFNEISTSFNTMAEELENTELLRSDFINNFSHEFKTPIVSIAGFAKLLKKGNLTDEQRQQYLDAIEEESIRLSYMATNVLNMTKIENQTILTDLSTFNLSEQMRSCVLLLEGKWAKKGIDLQIDLPEVMIQANEELLKQAWINLIDNAIKFSPDGGTVAFEISDNTGKITVSISNEGTEIPPDKLTKIFHKFYQADESHAREGNGIGLVIVSKVVQLHRGQIEVASENGKTTFAVTLPAKQWEHL